MKLPKSLTTVTTFSKLIALCLFILFPFVGFYVGMRYQQKLDHVDTKERTSTYTISPTPAVRNTPNICTQEAKQCSDGTWVGRSGPKCEVICPK